MFVTNKWPRGLGPERDRAAQTGVAVTNSIWKRLIPIAVSAMVLGGAPAAHAAIEGDTVVLQGLDKVTARVWTFDARIGEPIRFGTLEIIPRFCARTPPEEPPESKAFLEIYEVRDGQKGDGLFQGWMFASSPALNALEHPVYDVWVIDCKQTQALTPPPADPPESAGTPDTPPGPKTPEAPR